MILDTKIADKTAAYLLQINAIKLNPKNPFQWASGWKSPIYCDNRLALSYPEIRHFLAQSMAQNIREKYPQLSHIAGVATGAIGIGLLVAEALELPFVYVRPEAKKHGRKNQVEGQLPQNAKVVVIEDLISTGKSSLNAVTALQESKATVLGMLAIFNYGFKISDAHFKQAGVALDTLCDYEHLIAHANRQGLVADDQLNILQAWRQNPEQWNPEEN